MVYVISGLYKDKGGLSYSEQARGRDGFIGVMAKLMESGLCEIPERITNKSGRIMFENGRFTSDAPEWMVAEYYEQIAEVLRRKKWREGN